MVKILSRSGNSLADIYDAEGSIAGIDQLETRELPIMHEMGATVFSERLQTRIFRIPTTAIAQNIAFRIQLDTLPETPARLLGLQVITDNGARVTRAAVLATDPVLLQDFPIWVWNGVAADSELVTMLDATVSASFEVMLAHGPMNMLPTFTGGNEQQDNMVSSLTLVGLTSGFGAGTVLVTALAHIAFPRRDVNISSRGLPIPSW